jgi:hypothetical protein
MTKGSEIIKRHREKVKKLIVDSMGGSCQVCGYKKCIAALELHHINPQEKDFSFSKVRANNANWAKIVEELRKCILVCANCHREVHNNDLKLPTNYKKFDETFKFVGSKRLKVYDNCSICGNIKPETQKYCSTKCHATSKKNSGKINWDSINLEELIKKYKTNVAVGEFLGVSDAYISRRRRKLAEL